MKLLVDVAGADKGISVPILAAINVREKLGIKICFVGKKDEIYEEFKRLNKENQFEKFELLECEEYITNDDEPVSAIRKKTNSNLVKALEYMKINENIVFISSSNTGALMAGALLKLGRMKGIHRPALITCLPKVTGQDVVFLDSGANPQAREISLMQYAKLGKIYAKYILNIETPKIGLLNIGAESEKGTPELKEVNKSLSKVYGKDFIGNVEARYILNSEADVIVADGLMGNVAIKSLEGAVSTIKKVLKAELTKGILNKFKALIISGTLKKIMQKFNYKNREGAVLLGVKKPIIKVHGSSDVITYEKALFQAKKMLETDIIKKISDEINSLEQD